MSHALSFLGAISPGMASLADPAMGNLPYTKTLLPGGIAGVAGALYGLKIGHPFLGFVMAESLGQNAFRTWRGQGNDRTIAACNVGQALAIVAGSLLWKQHPFWGGLAGLAVGLVATSLVKGSNANVFVLGLRK
ncbi:MAG: hypothetical protein V4550_18435 [Gemmatimonadota bacterium]